MGQTTDKIETFIESKRAELGANLEELEEKVKSATDWRQQFQKRPMALIGVALGGGVLLATLLPKRGKRARVRHQFNGTVDRASNEDRDHQKNEALGTLDNIKSALIGVAATRLTDFVGQFVPGFRQELQRKATASSTGSSYRT